jgi:hypothetical protein
MCIVGSMVIDSYGGICRSYGCAKGLCDGAGSVSGRSAWSVIAGIA